MYKVHMAKLGSQDHQGLKLELQVDSCLSFTVSQTESHFAPRECQNYGLAIVCYIWKDRKKLIIKILVSIAVYDGHSLSEREHLKCSMPDVYWSDTVKALKYILLNCVVHYLPPVSREIHSS